MLLLDLGLPRTRDLEGLARIQSLDAHIPVVIVTDRDDEAVALRALHVGAQDYLIKGSLTTDSLVRSIHYATERHSLVRQLVEAQIILKNRNHRLSKLYRTAYKFVDNVSHEFRTPLTVIKEYAALIQDGIVGVVLDEQRQLLAVIEDRADDLNNMVDDMLDVSKLEAGLLGVYRKQCSAAEIVAHVRPALERKAAAKAVQVDWDVPMDLPLTYCDPGKAGRVLINLTINAIKFCGRPGHVRLSCRKCQDAPGIEFSVSDNGEGISVENQRALFQRFRQLNESFRSTTKGFGLGLSIAKDLVEANLGEIRVDSEAGRGSTFSFTLPPADPAVVMRRYLNRVDKLCDAAPYVTLVQADIEETAVESLAEDLDGFLSGLLRHNDLSLRVGPHRWLMALSIADSEFPAFRQRIGQELHELGRNRLADPLPEVEFGLLGTWGVRNHEQIVGRLCEVAQTENSDCV